MTNTLLRNKQVVIMAPGRPDSEQVDLLIGSTRNVQIGADLPSHEAEVIDTSGRIVISGLVNAHLHTWQTGLRSVGADWTPLGYLMNPHGAAATHFSPSDVEIANLARSLNQINCGVAVRPSAMPP